MTETKSISKISSRRKKKFSNSKSDKLINNDYIKLCKDFYHKIVNTILSIYLYLLKIYKTSCVKLNNKWYANNFKDLIFYIKKSWIGSKLIYIPLLLEIYVMIYGRLLLIRSWFIFNFICTILCVYDELSDAITKNRLVPISRNDIKKIATISIGLGVFIILFYSVHIGFFIMALIMYLINRTCKNIFNRGF